MTYDFVIVGAGSAGCVLANRLSADPGIRVLLIEAGGPDRAMEVRIPAAFKKLFKTPLDWNYTTVPQAGLDGRALYWPRGRMLGGSSSMNAQMWARGHRADYDGWAEAGNDGWDYDSVVPFFHRAERRAGSNARGCYGTEGPLWIEELRDPNPLTGAFLAACAESGLTRLAEMNGPDNTGFAPTPVTQHRGRRWSAADGYLRPALGRSNLTVITGALVHRVLLDGDRATGVEYRDAAGTVTRAEATREVILSAGAIGSPHLLQLSGIGDPDRLAAAGIDMRHELPLVGEGLQDHLAVVVAVRTPRPISLVSAESTGNLLRYLLFRKGMLTSNVGEAAAFIRSDPTLPAPDLELIFAPVPFLDHGLTDPPGHGMSIGIVLLQPESRGRITATSADPAEAPLIDPGYLTDPGGHDLRRLVHGVEQAQHLYATAALSPHVSGPIEPADPGADREAFIRSQAETLYHPVGTCAMGAVVDATLRVHGLTGLRVVDASVQLNIIRGHTHAPTVMVAERAAALIRDPASYRPTHGAHDV